MKIAEEKLGGVRTMSDENLLNLCAKFGARALKWRGKFLGLLPEANRRRLFEKKGFNSIFEFAFKLAGLSEEQVRVVLRLDLKFDDKPVLKGLLVGGEVSVSKLARVASVATAENEHEWAEMVNTLPRHTLETLVRDQKVTDGRQEVEGLSEPLFEPKSLPGHVLDFQITDEVVSELNQLNFQGHDVNQLILEMLEKRREEIVQKKEKLGEEAIEKLAKRRKEVAEKAGTIGAQRLAGSGKTAKEKKSTYVSVKVKAVLHEEYGEKCSIPTCSKLADGTHHSQRLSIAGLHDPRYMAPMCKEHHQIAHLVDLKYRENVNKKG